MDDTFLPLVCQLSVWPRQCLYPEPHRLAGLVRDRWLGPDRVLVQVLVLVVLVVVDYLRPDKLLHLLVPENVVGARRDVLLLL